MRGDVGRRCIAPFYVEAPATSAAATVVRKFGEVPEDLSAPMTAKRA
jgi:hypothetical protein